MKLHSLGAIIRLLLDILLVKDELTLVELVDVRLEPVKIPIIIIKLGTVGGLKGARGVHGVIDGRRKVGISEGKVLVDETGASLVEWNRKVVGEILTGELQHDLG